MFGKNEVTADKVHVGSEAGEIINNREDIKQIYSECEWRKQVHQIKSYEDLNN